MLNYRNIETVEDLYTVYPGAKSISKNIFEEKQDGKADEEIKQSVFYDNNLPVEYADLKKVENIFNHIIIFTNDRDPKCNKTLNNIYEAIEEFKKANCVVPKLHVFVAANVESKEDESEIIIKDDKEEFIITEQNNTDTLVFSRLGVQDEYECEHIVKLLQDRGFLVLNPVQYAAIACDKYETAVLLQKANIPQPNFTLMTKDILYDKELFILHLKEIYKDWDDKDDDKNEKFEVVIKILNGHGGTGVFLTNGKRMKAILQAIFAINKNQELILQKKEEADGGDIRVHVLTLKNKQIIVGAMKRVKLGGDFRSNVSLGATAEKVKLTPEQEQIALKTAKVSKLPWCAVDIMPIVKGTNKELGDNAVLEINASPGTDGISEVIGKNFVRVLISQLTNPNEFYLQDKIAGYHETIEIFWDGKNSKSYLAKLDTGNGTKGSSIEVGDYTEKDGKIIFSINNKEYIFDVVGHSNAVTGNNDELKIDKRPIIVIPKIKIGLRCANDVKFSIIKKRDKSTNVLINRDLLSCLGYVVSPRQIHILTKEIEKIKII